MTAPAQHPVQTFAAEVAAKFAAHAAGQPEDQLRGPTERLLGAIGAFGVFLFSSWRARSWFADLDALASRLQVTPSSGPAMKPGRNMPPASTRSQP